ncbi:MAG: TIGR03084 family protein [Acidimicrobiaceae bacterium]|jgi:uncharacterized protein (TIGR03084 family)|nr:TIGR03084 family protein [Acidimicrobiaceae bacterium]MBT5852237.1 TIGR03084 family protein [Acidimicrobiaceae bacterium]
MSTVTVASVIADLVAEQDALDAVVTPLAAADWDLATPSPRWAVRDQIGHLAFFDETAALAISDPEGFIQHRTDFVAAAFATPGAGDELTLGPAREMTAKELLLHWRSCRNQLAAAAAECGEKDRIEWYGPSMGAKSFLTARLMEAWAHGQDICDTVNTERESTDRLRHIAQLGFITRGWTYINRKIEIPEGDICVELDSPSGETWIFGPADALATIRGPAKDFCLVTSQRRNLADTSLAIHGAIAQDWLEKAQLFAGPPSSPPAPRS